MLHFVVVPKSLGSEKHSSLLVVSVSGKEKKRLTPSATD
jgi:hypothetical protein